MKNKKGYIMALEIRSIPVLEGEVAERFVREAEENARKPRRMKPAFTSQQIENMLQRGIELRKKIESGKVKLK